MESKEQWPASYLQGFSAFTSDSKSKKHLAVHVDRYIAEQKKGPRIHIIDVCCGSGVAGKIVAEHILNKGYKVEATFLDQSFEILNKIKSEDSYKINTVNCEIHAGTSLPENTFDIAICRYGFNNLAKEEWEASLNEVLRILKPGGVFILQDHFIPGLTFSFLVNEAEQYLASIEGKNKSPYIYSTEEFNRILDLNPLVESRVKTGYGLVVSIWERLASKFEILPDLEGAKQKIRDFYIKTCLDKYQLLIVDEEEYIHVYNITYAIKKIQGKMK